MPDTRCDDVAGQRRAVVGIRGHGAGRIDGARHCFLQHGVERLQLLDVFEQQVLQALLEAGRMRHQVAQGDGLAVVARDLEVEILVDVVIEIDAARFDQLHDRRPGEQLRDRARAEQRLLGGDRRALFHVAEAEGLRQQHAIVLHDHDDGARDVSVAIAEGSMPSRYAERSSSVERPGLPASCWRLPRASASVVERALASVRLAHDRVTCHGLFVVRELAADGAIEEQQQQSGRGRDRADRTGKTEAAERRLHVAPAAPAVRFPANAGEEPQRDGRGGEAGGREAPEQSKPDRQDVELARPS